MRSINGIYKNTAGALTALTLYSLTVAAKHKNQIKLKKKLLLVLSCKDLQLIKLN